MSRCCCCSDGPSLADDPRFVFSIYAIAFIPLASIYALDFITDKWRTIRDTRRNGTVQLLVSLPSLACVIFYIVAQIENRDYKEAAAAIAVAVFNSYHVLRTIWGLILLYEFRNWNIYALRCLVSVGYIVPVYGYSRDVKNMLSKVKSCRARWKRPLIRLFDSLKTRFMHLYNRFLSCTHPVSSLHSSVRSTSPSSAISDGSFVDPSGVSHDPNSSSTSSASTTNENDSHQLREQNSFSSTLRDDSILGSQTRLFRLFHSLKTTILFLFSAIRDPNRFYKRVKKCSLPLYNWAMGNMEDGLTFYPSLEEIKRTVDYHMLVNSSLIDNEFTNAELPVRPALFSRVIYRDAERHSGMARFVASCLKSTKPEECSVRWLVSFLARFGFEWLVDTKDQSNESLTNFQKNKRWSSLKLGVLAPAHITQGSVKDNGSTESFVTLFSPYHRYCLGDANYFHGEIDITQRCMLPFKMNAAFGKKMPFYGHQATIRDAAKDDWHKTSLNELDDAQRSAVENITDSQLALFAVLMENVEFLNEDDTVLSDINTDRYWEAERRSRDTLIYQLGYDPGEDVEPFFGSLPVRKAALSSFLWHNNPNSLLLQASVHVDNYLALKSGDRLDAFVGEWQTASQAGASERTRSVFENQYNLEMRRLQCDVASLLYCTSNPCDIGRFIGCVTEAVRSILASWVVENDCEADGWNASIAPVGIRFLSSKQLCSAISEVQNIGRWEEEMQGLYMRLIWEVQSHLQWKVGEEVIRNVGDIRQSPFLIMLFVLGFPSLKVEASKNEGIVSGSHSGDPRIEFEDGITVRPVAGPQELRLLLTCDQESKTVSVIFSPESLVFHWQEWRDAFMGRVAAQRHWRMTRLSSNNEVLRTEMNNLDISAPVHHIGPEQLGKEYGLRYWSGWTPFIPQIAQFEIRNMVENEHGVWDVEHFAERSSEFIRDLNTAIDIHIEQTTDVETLYAGGCDAVEEGHADDALRIFGRCIAEHGHREALKDAFGIISRKSTKCDSQVDALQKQIDVRFRTLLNRSHIEEQNRSVGEIDLGMLANYFGRIYELTGSEDALERKAVSLFYENGGNSTVSEKAIHAIESFIICEGGHSSFAFYLAVAHQSVFHESQDRAHQEIAAKCMVGLRNWVWYSDPADCFVSNIGYMLEKGFFVGRDAKRMNAIIKTICERTGYGDEKMLLAIVGRLFVKQSASDVRSNEAIGNERVFGIGIRPKEAMSLYLVDPGFFHKCTNRLGLLYHKGAQGIPADALAAEERYSVAIENGNRDAICNMGVLQCDTAGDEGGISYLKRAVEAGCSCGMNNLAVTYEVGNGINRDVLEAERLYKQCIEVDKNPVAMYNLAVLYMWGDPEVQNDENRSASLHLISELMRAETELEPLYTLQEQVRRLSVLRGSRDETVSTRKVEVEELDDCLAYVKILESCGTDSVPGDEDGLEIGK